MLDANEAEIRSQDTDVLEMKADENEADYDDITSNHGNTEAPSSVRIEKRMTMEEMVANSFIILTAGYETTRLDKPWLLN